MKRTSLAAMLLSQVAGEIPPVRAIDTEGHRLSQSHASSARAAGSLPDEAETLLVDRPRHAEG
jgi:hypothetical protein